MAKYAKWIGGGLGWVLGGPIGAVIGFIAGSFFDNSSSKSSKSTQAGDFAVALVVVTAVVMKANKVLKKSELDYVKAFFVRNFG